MRERGRERETQTLRVCLAVAVNRSVEPMAHVDVLGLDRWPWSDSMRTGLSDQR